MPLTRVGLDLLAMPRGIATSQSRNSASVTATSRLCWRAIGRLSLLMGIALGGCSSLSSSEEGESADVPRRPSGGGGVRGEDGASDVLNDGGAEYVAADAEDGVD